MRPPRRPSRQICASCGQPLPIEKPKPAAAPSGDDAQAVARVRERIEASIDRGETDQEFQLQRQR